MKRSKHTLSHYRMLTTNMGVLQPVSCVPTLPGDTFQGNVTALIRVSPLNTPVMHPVNVRTESWFVPYRVLWPEAENGGWENFITGGEDGMNTATIPTIQTTATKNTVLTGLGLPPIAGIDVSVLPVRAFNEIYNKRYRDQDLCPKRALDDITLPKIAWEKDRFSTARPFSQKGPQVTLPVGDKAPIFQDTGSGEYIIENAQGSGVMVDMDTSGARLTQGGTSVGRQLMADLANADSPDVNDWRAAFSLQRYQEARARYGSRFTEYLRYCGVTPSDARIQDPEFLGSGRARLNFSEVLQTSQPDPTGSPGQGVGDLYGHGISGMRTNKWRKFFEEHGVVVTVMSVRPKALYLNGVAREWLKTNKEDYYQKELANLGQQEVYQAELYGENTRDVFGWEDRYGEYRQHPSQISGDFRDTLNAWQLGRDLQPDVVLNQDFVECDPSGRIFQVDPASGPDSLWCMINNHIVARRPVPARANPRII